MERVMQSCRLIKAILLNRWMVVVATFFIMACAGATYNYGLYSQEMKLALGYNQKTVNTIGFFKDLGANVGVISGLIYDLTGPWVVLMIGSGLNLFGYLMIWLAVTKKIAAPKVWQMCLYICIGANSQAFTNTGVVVTSVKNFPRSRGMVIGLLKGYVGLSGAMLTLLYQAVYGNHPASFILLIAWMPCLVCLLFMFVVRRMPPNTDGGAASIKSEKKIFYIFLVIALVLAVYLMIVIVVQHLHSIKISKAGFQAFAAVMFVIILLPLVVVVKEELQKLKKKELPTDDPIQIQLKSDHQKTAAGIEMHEKQSLTEQEYTHPESDASSLKKWEKLKILVWQRPTRGSDFSILEAVFSIDMFLIFIATTSGVGAGLMAIDNLGQLGASLGYAHPQVATFVSLLSIWNFLGRVGSGFISEIFLERYAVPRTLFFAIAQGIAAIGHAVIAFNVPGALFIGSIIIGLSFGAIWALMFTVISELFGLKYYGTLYNVGGVASPLGSYLLSVRVAGYFYDLQADKEHRSLKKNLIERILVGLSSNDLLCNGPKCYRISFFIMAAVCSFGCFVALILTIRTTKFYRKIHDELKKGRLQEAEEESITDVRSGVALL